MARETPLTCKEHVVEELAIISHLQLKHCWAGEPVLLALICGIFRETFYQGEFGVSMWHACLGVTCQAGAGQVHDVTWQEHEQKGP